MKVDIYDTKIDFNKLINSIREFEVYNNQEAYLIMNERTSEKLAYTTMSFINPGWSLKDKIDTGGYLAVNGKGYLAKFRGNTILIDNELADGEVEIR